MRKGVVGSLLLHAALLAAVWTWALPPRAAAPLGRVSLHMLDAPTAPQEERDVLPELDTPTRVKVEFDAEPEAEPVEFEQEIAEPAVVQPRGVRIVRLARPLPRTRPAPAPPPDVVPIAPHIVKRVPKAPVGPTRGPVLLNLRDEQPVYPRDALRRGIEGVVTLVIDVDRDGGIVNLTVEQSSGHRLLDRAAIRAAKKWRFQPALERGRRVAARYTRTIRFELLHG